MKSCYNVYPRADFGLMQREIDRMFGQKREATGADSGGARIGEDENHHYIELDAPGLKPDSLAVTVKDRELTVHADYGTPETETNPIQWRNCSPRAGAFDRQYRLPETFNADGISAAYNHGVLRITVPKSEETKPRQITVQVS